MCHIFTVLDTYIVYAPKIEQIIIARYKEVVSFDEGKVDNISVRKSNLIVFV